MPISAPARERLERSSGIAVAPVAGRRRPRPPPQSRSRPHNQNNGDARPRSSARADANDLHQPKQAPPRSSTWPLFLLHFALPMTLLLVVSNVDVNDVFPSLLPLRSTRSSSSSTGKKRGSAKPISLPTTPPPNSQSSNNYQRAIKEEIERKKKQKSSNSRQQQSDNSMRKRPLGPQSSPLYEQMEANIKMLRKAYQESLNTPNEYLPAVRYADFLKHRDVTIHDGGTYQMEAIEVYTYAIEILENVWRDKMARGEEVRPSTQESAGYKGLSQELFVDYAHKSTEGMLCAVYTNLGKVYFMSNMFERAVQTYEECLSYDHDYLDALSGRAQSLLILGKYAEAGRDYKRVLENDAESFFFDAVTGMAKVLTAKEEDVPGGWEFLVKLLTKLMPAQKELHKKALSSNANEGLIKLYTNALKRMHLAMFAYHDVKTKNADKAWNHLARGNEYKLSVLPPFDAALKKEQVERVKAVFSPSFFPGNIGSDSRTPIFIIGFVRSGSTLLERILDAHPLIVGTGEDSVFNGRLDTIRTNIVEASMVGDPQVLQHTVKNLADDVVADMKSRWEVIDANMHHEDDEEEDRPYPTRFADKMLLNYLNVGFIHLLFPNALILHVAREPMDCIFSAFKHDFPPGGLDYTSEFEGVAQLYHSYRDLMEHWDKVLPGRVTHVRYEDMVTDLPNIAPKIIEAAGVPWDPSVLDFHKKKHAVNTLSTTQVRKGVYSHHFKEWKRYEKFLQPLLDLVQSRAKYDLKTTLPGYSKIVTEPARP